MDVDLSDSDQLSSELLQKFSCLNTNDHEVLVREFKLLVGDKCCDSIAEFWLDMNNWNLQAAICAFFDYESSTPNFNYKLPSIIITILDVKHKDLLPNSPFSFHFQLTNIGDESLPCCCLKHCSGPPLFKEDRWILPQLGPQQTCDLNFPFIAPEMPGCHLTMLRISTITGQFFGEPIFIISNVLDDLSMVTKQLSSTQLIDCDGIDEKIDQEAQPILFNDFGDNFFSQSSISFNNNNNDCLDPVSVKSKELNEIIIKPKEDTNKEDSDLDSM
ncbi:28S ribosomal protein S18c [Sarcoptes scabiei]|nr:28S ribosomal protein S18c [Sarcoptes scabiei]